MDARIPRGHACRIHSRRPSPVLGLTQPPDLPSRQFIRHFIRQPGVKPVRRLCACLCSLAKNDCAKAHPLRCAGLAQASHIISVCVCVSLSVRTTPATYRPLSRTTNKQNLIFFFFFCFFLYYFL